MRALTPRQVTPTTVCGTQTLTMCQTFHDAQSQVLKGRPYPTLYAMSGFHIEMGGFLYAAAIDARHDTNLSRHDMAAGL